MKDDLSSIETNEWVKLSKIELPLSRIHSVKNIEQNNSEAAIIKDFLALVTSISRLVAKRPPLGAVLRQFNPLRVFIAYSFEIRFNVMQPSLLRTLWTIFD